MYLHLILMKFKKNQTAYAEEFKNLDTSGDEKLNWKEASKDTTIQHKAFKSADKDVDGMLDVAEYGELKTQLSQKKVGQVVSDSVITTKAKATLLKEESLKSLKISVETHKGEVILSGFVNDETMKAKAAEVVKNIEGVKSIVNSLVVKS